MILTSFKDLVSIEGSGFQTSDKGSRPFSKGQELNGTF